jgi:predicted TIM-barrel fold metal-dependent hydrolase
VTEPPDLWTSRVSKKYVDLMPRVEIDPDGEPRWIINGEWMGNPGWFAYAGWKEYPPSAPVTMEDAQRASWDPHARLKLMDEYGIYAAVLYPNIVGFETRRFVAMGGQAAIEAMRAYNDFLTDFASADPVRLIPVAMLPFWDLEVSVKELRRCAAAGHRGVLFANKYELIDLPVFTDPHWDPIYRTAEELGLPINFHIGFARNTTTSEVRGKSFAETYDGRQVTADTATGMMISNATTISALLVSDVLDRFPTLQFVSVESGMGYIPYLLDSLDWHWHGYGMRGTRELLPSEYFQRQCYGTFWFETTTMGLLEVMPDKFMFSTDYPHPTSVSPGPCSPALPPNEHAVQQFQNVPEDIARKALYENAARLYGLNVPA